MSQMRREILNAMSNLEVFEPEGIQAEFTFPDVFCGFQGHFPNNPILPGVCKIQAVMVMLDAFYQKKFRLLEVSAAKYFRPVSQDEKVCVELHVNVLETGVRSVKGMMKKKRGESGCASTPCSRNLTARFLC